jgi:DNA replication and repair protein RecF
LRVEAVEASPLRSLDGARFALEPGITAIVGPNGAGKTNLLEALFFALTGRSFRTADRRELIPFGASLGRAQATVEDAAGSHRQLLASVSRSEGRRHLLDGAPVDAATARRHRPPLSVFSPDRLSLIKGPPGERRAALDLFAAARWPSRGELRRRYGQALAQRNALLGRVAAGVTASADLDSWDEALATSAAPLIAARAEAAAELATPFAASAEDLGLGTQATFEYAPRAEGGAAEIRIGLEQRREADLRLGRTSWGPHLDEVQVALGGRSLRRYGSQGQQRLGLLAWLFAERGALLAAGSPPSLLLLDDVMSELDPERRDRLGVRLAEGGQTLISAADETALPGAAAVIRMPGAVRGPTALAA